ncbi:MAG TPA: energy transducer TonB [Pyrinomonadaceae bacterium]|nr:energy transducer TonB [Pyrinomonadaceae bacterium]
MKTTLALVLFALALSLCNLMGRRSNTNTNSNSRSSGEMAESSPASNSADEPVKETAAPPTVTQGVPRAGAPGSLPSANHDSAASAPPPPPKKEATPKPPPKVISGGVLNGKAISKLQPAYPPIAKAAKASGMVTVQVLVDESGNVVTARAVSGHPLLQQSAVAAARNWKFSPTVLSGQPVKVSGVITFNFVAQ